MNHSHATTMRHHSSDCTTHPCSPVSRTSSVPPTILTLKQWNIGGWMTHVDNEVLGHRVACQVRILRIKLSELQSAQRCFCKKITLPEFELRNWGPKREVEVGSPSSLNDSFYPRGQIPKQCTMRARSFESTSQPKKNGGVKNWWMSTCILDQSSWLRRNFETYGLLNNILTLLCRVHVHLSQDGEIVRRFGTVFVLLALTHIHHFQWSGEPEREIF